MTELSAQETRLLIERARVRNLNSMNKMNPASCLSLHIVTWSNEI